MSFLDQDAVDQYLPMAPEDQDKEASRWRIFKGRFDTIMYYAVCLSGGLVMGVWGYGVVRALATG